MPLDQRVLLLGLASFPRALENTLRGSLQDPDWTADGRRVAFRFLASGDYEDTRVQVINADGSKLVDLSQRSGIRGSSPSWSPDASRIAFSGKRAGDARESIWVVDADGTKRTTVLGPRRRAGVPMAWSPGARLAVNCSGRRDDDVGICTVDADGSRFRRVVDDGGFPGWRPTRRMRSAEPR